MVAAQKIFSTIFFPDDLRERDPPCGPKRPSAPKQMPTRRYAYYERHKYQVRTDRSSTNVVKLIIFIHPIFLHRKKAARIRYDSLLRRNRRPFQRLISAVASNHPAHGGGSHRSAARSCHARTAAPRGAPRGSARARRPSPRAVQQGG
jgi:hypothetical protein